MTKILQPLVIELHLKSRTDEVIKTVSKETPKLNPGDNQEESAALTQILEMTNKCKTSFVTT